MIGTIDIKCVAARPNQPLSPLFTFTGSPSSVRIMDVPKSIGEWNITTVSLVVKYPDNSTMVKNAVRSGSVWVATIQGTEITGKVSNGFEIVADGIDEDGNEVTGYVLGCGDVFVLNRDSKVMKDLEKFYVKYSDELPTTPARGDLVSHNGSVQLFDGENWISLGSDPTVIGRLEEEIAEVDAKVDEVDAKVDEVDDKLYNKRDYFNIKYPTTPDRDPSKYGIYNPDLIVNGQVTVLNEFLFNMDGSTWKSSDGVYKLNTKNGLDFTLTKNGAVIHTFSRTLDHLNIDEMWFDAQNIPHQLISMMLFSHLALSSDVTEEIGVAERRVMAAMPEKTSDIENDSGYITQDEVPDTTRLYNEDKNKYIDGNGTIYEYFPEPTVRWIFTDGWDRELKVYQQSSGRYDYYFEGCAPYSMNRDAKMHSTQTWTTAEERDAITQLNFPAIGGLGFPGVTAFKVTLTGWQSWGVLATTKELPKSLSQLINDKHYTTIDELDWNYIQNVPASLQSAPVFGQMDENGNISITR